MKSIQCKADAVTPPFFASMWVLYVTIHKSDNIARYLSSTCMMRINLNLISSKQQLFTGPPIIFWTWMVPISTAFPRWKIVFPCIG